MNHVNTNPKSIDKLLDSFARTTDEIYSLQTLRELLRSGRQLRIKYGVDVTAPDLHIGHAVNLWMQRELQELGHKVIFLIGDFTTQIGDPTGKNKLRPVLPLDEIERNAEAFISQAAMVLHRDPDLTEVRRNSEWYDTMPAKALLSLMSLVTHDKLISRDMFRKRLAEGHEVYEHELIYPILQGYDSVMLKSDLTVIGSDQLFNEMMGRFYQEKFGQPAQVVITTTITPGIDGLEKQSKSLGNYIGLSHSPREKFGRVMSIPDSLILDYFKVYTDVPMPELADIGAEVMQHPMECKLRLAREITKRYHGVKVADEEHEWFVKTFSSRETPADIPTVTLEDVPLQALAVLRRCLDPQQASNSEIRRLVSQGGVTIDGKTVTDINQTISVSPQGSVLKVGKRKWFRLVSSQTH